VNKYRSYSQNNVRDKNNDNNMKNKSFYKIYIKKADKNIHKIMLIKLAMLVLYPVHMKSWDLSRYFCPYNAEIISVR